jgi:hypothetical protein
MFWARYLNLGKLHRITCLLQAYEYSPADSLDSLQHLWNPTTWEIHAIILKFLFIGLHVVMPILVTAPRQITYAHKSVSNVLWTKYTNQLIFCPLERQFHEVVNGHITLFLPNLHKQARRRMLRMFSPTKYKKICQYTVQYLSLTAAEGSKIPKQDKR